MADSLAKKHQEPTTHILQFNHTNIHNPNFIIQWKGQPIEKPTRQLIKDTGRAYTIAMWSSQKRNAEWESHTQTIDWGSTWLYLNNNSKATTNITSPN